MMNITIHNTSYAYEVHGNGEAVLLLHGFTGSKKTWAAFLPRWCVHHQVITVDIIGHGQSDAPASQEEYQIEKVAKDMMMLLDKLQLKKVHLLGYSMGGRLAIAIAALYPERIHSLVLESTTAGIVSREEREIRRKQDNQLANQIEREGIKKFVAYWEEIPLFATQKQLPLSIQQKIRKERLEQKEIGLANSLRGMGTGVQGSYWEQLQQFSFPTLLLCGERDKKFCYIASKLMEQLPNAVRKEFPNTGHAIHVENEEKFGTIISEWLEGNLIPFRQ